MNIDIRDLVLGPYDKPIMNNTHRAHFVECLIALALGDKWQLTWQQGWDWAAWDLESKEGVRLEVKQAAARQSWDPPETPQRIPRFDIAPRDGYWTGEGSQWKELRGRHADTYVFAWHGEPKAELCDQRNAEQWVFYVVPEKDLPDEQKSIGLTALENLLTPCRISELKRAVIAACPLPKERKAFLDT